MSTGGLSQVLTLLACGSLIALGTALLFLAWRGRRLDDHPVCKACRRDLFGLDASTQQCPECGTPVAGNTTIGNRARRPLLAGGASLLIVLGLLLGSVSVAMRMSNIQWIQFTPASWLIERLSDNANKQRQDEALNELSRRMKSAELTISQKSLVYDNLLALQKDRTITWNRAWGDVLDRAYVAGELSGSQREMYYAQLFVPSIAIRPRIGRRGKLPIQSGQEFRTGNFNGNGPQLVQRSRLRSVRIVDGPVLQDDGPEWRGYGGSSVGGGGSTTSYLDLQNKLAPGDYELELVHEFQLRTDWGDKATVLHEMSHTVMLPLSVLEDVSVGWAVSKVSAEQMSAHFTIGDRNTVFSGRVSDEIKGSKVTLQITDNGARFNANLNVEKLPEDFGCAIVIEADGNTFENSSVYFAKDATSGWHTSGTDFAVDVAEKLVGKTVTVRLISSREAAEKSMNLTQTWKGEVVLREVKIEVEDRRTTK